MFSFEQLSRMSQGKVLAANASGAVTHFITDSRNYVAPAGGMFVAIKGAHHDGHDYLRQVFDKGIRYFLIENKAGLDPVICRVASVLLVKDSIVALQQISADYRKQFQYPVLGITGSNGKTIIKEWLARMLGGQYKVVKSPKSYNSQLGVPLSVLQMQNQHNLAIFEAGISQPGEMKNLQAVIRPTIGIFTNLGSAHDEGFRDAEQKAMEKWQLFAGAEVVICCADHPLIMQTKPADVRIFAWGRDAGADLRIIQHEKREHDSEFLLSYKNKNFKIKVPFIHEAPIENIMHCLALMIYLKGTNQPWSSILGGISHVEMRLELKKGVNNCYLIDDSYNNDLRGLQIAMDFLKSQPGSRKRVILSDVLQSGLEEKELYRQINQLLLEHQVHSLIGVGEGMQSNAESFGLQAHFYPSTDQFLADEKALNFHDETILIKGARPFQFEKISRRLSEKLHHTVLEIDLEALISNLNFFRAKLHEQVRLMVMVKAASYGNGSIEIASLLQHHKVDYLAVAYTDEGVALRKNGITLPIMVMNVTPENFENIALHNLEPEVFSLSQATLLSIFANEHKISLKIHVKIDSGMHRLGFEADQVDALAELLSCQPQMQVTSIYSHLAGADEQKHDSFTRSQVSKFLSIAAKLEKALDENDVKPRPLKHILNSAGILNYPEYQMDMVRLGIGLYGFDASGVAQSHLRYISTLKTVISQVREVKEGETIGYGRHGKATKDATIATIAIGYADGFSRAFGNGAIVLQVHGQLAPVIGNVCMDMTMLDVTGIDARAGDEVIVFGDKPTIIDLARAMNTIPYEILTNISSRVKRVFYTQ